MKTKKLAVLGAGGHGKVIADIAKLLEEWCDIVFVDDDLNKIGITISNIKVLGTFDSIGTEIHPNEYELALAVGNNQARASLFARFSAIGFKFPTLIHPSAVVSPDSRILSGTVIVAQSVINPGTVIGYGCIVNTSASVGHDCNISDFVHIAPGVNLAGHTIIDRYTWVGIGSCTRQCVHIGSNVMIGAGSVVVSDIDNDSIIFGNPAKIVDKNKRI